MPQSLGKRSRQPKQDLALSHIDFSAAEDQVQKMQKREIAEDRPRAKGACTGCRRSKVRLTMLSRKIRSWISITSQS
jgi:hypothetical protein